MTAPEIAIIILCSVNAAMNAYMLFRRQVDLVEFDRIKRDCDFLRSQITNHKAPHPMHIWRCDVPREKGNDNDRA